MKPLIFKLEIVSLSDGYHVMRSEEGTDDMDCLLGIPITTFRAVFQYLEALENHIKTKCFKLIEKEKNYKESVYRLRYEALPLL